MWERERGRQGGTSQRTKDECVRERTTQEDERKESERIPLLFRGTEDVVLVMSATGRRDEEE